MTTVIAKDGYLITDSKTITVNHKSTSETIHYTSKIKYFPGLVLGFYNRLPTDQEMVKLNESLTSTIRKALQGEEVEPVLLELGLGTPSGYSFIGLYSMIIDGREYKGGVRNDSTFSNSLGKPLLRFFSLEQYQGAGSGDDIGSYLVHAGMHITEIMPMVFRHDPLSGGEINIANMVDIPVYTYDTPVVEANVEVNENGPE